MPTSGRRSPHGRDRPAFDHAAGHRVSQCPRASRRDPPAIGDRNGVDRGGSQRGFASQYHRLSRLRSAGRRPGSGSPCLRGRSVCVVAAVYRVAAPKIQDQFFCANHCAKPWLNDLGFVVAGEREVTVIGAGSLGPRPALGVELARGLSIHQIPAAVSSIGLSGHWITVDGSENRRIRHTKVVRIDTVGNCRAR